MRRNPGTTFVSFLALVLGIGASTTIYSIVNGIVLRPLPVKDAGRLVQIYSTNTSSQTDGVSMADFLDWRRQLHSFSALSLYGLTQVTLTGVNTPERVIAGQADAQFFPLLGIAPLQGRTFRPSEDEPGRSTKVLLSRSFWQQHFRGQDVLGTKIFLDEKPFTVVGILPDSVSAIAQGDIWLPMTFDRKADENQRGFHTYMAIGKLASGRTLAQANQELAVVSNRLAVEYPRQNKGLSARAVSLSEASSYGGQSDIQGKIQPVLAMVLAAVGCILLIACANVANISLARALSRQREIAARIALGASNTRLFRQLLTESLLVSTAAALAGLGLAAAAIKVFRSLPLTSVPRLDQVTIDWRVLLFAAVLAISTGALVSVLPALRAGRINIADTLRQASGALTEAHAQRRAGALFVALQTALATALLIESGLLAKSLLQASDIRLGMGVNHLLTLYLSLPSSRYSYRNPGHVGPFAQAVLNRVRSLPGVQAAAVTTDLPFTTPAGGGGILAEGQEAETETWNAPIVYWTMISPGYFGTMEIPILRGHDFNAASASDVVIVNRAFAHRFFGDRNPVGKHIAPVETEIKWREIVGIVPDVPQGSVEAKIVPQMFIPVARLDPPWLALVVRTSGDPLSYIEAVRQVTAKIDGSVAVFLPRTLTQLLGRQFLWRRLQTWVVTGFALISLALACFGVYSVIAYSVDRRLREIGLRAALGASRENILRVTVWQGSAPAVFGILAGLGLGFAAAKATSRLLFGVSAAEASIYVLAAAVILLAVLSASYFPARRASAVDPWIALRHE